MAWFIETVKKVKVRASGLQIGDTEVVVDVEPPPLVFAKGTVDDVLFAALYDFGLEAIGAFRVR
jgi:hypothetical protein